MTFRNFYFQIFDKAVGKEETIIFLAHLLQHLRCPLLVVWDWLPAHRSKLVGEFLDSLHGQIAVEYLPPYAPELNPVEYLRGYWKHHQLPNVCARKTSGISTTGPARHSGAGAAGLIRLLPFGNSLRCFSGCPILCETQ